MHSEDTSNKCVQPVSDEHNLFWSEYLILCAQLYRKWAVIPIVRKHGDSQECYFQQCIERCQKGVSVSILQKLPESCSWVS